MTTRDVGRAAAAARPHRSVETLGGRTETENECIEMSGTRRRRRWIGARERWNGRGGERGRTEERGGAGWLAGMDHLAAPQSSNEIWLEINHRGVRAHRRSRSRKWRVHVSVCLCASPTLWIAIRAEGAHARAAKHRRTAARSARTRYYESRGPSSGENNGQPFRDNDELALHLARVYVYHPSPLVIVSLASPFFLSRFSRLFRPHWRFCTPRLCFVLHRSGVNDRCVCVFVHYAPLHASYAASRFGEINLYCTCRDTRNYSVSVSCTFLVCI